jgi:hypothetical protein
VPFDVGRRLPNQQLQSCPLIAVTANTVRIVSIPFFSSVHSLETTYRSFCYTLSVSSGTIPNFRCAKIVNKCHQAFSSLHYSVCQFTATRSWIDLKGNFTTTSWRKISTSRIASLCILTLFISIRIAQNIHGLGVTHQSLPIISLRNPAQRQPSNPSRPEVNLTTRSQGTLPLWA